MCICVKEKKKKSIKKNLGLEVKYDETYDDVQFLFLQTAAQSGQNPYSTQRIQPSCHRELPLSREAQYPADPARDSHPSSHRTRPGTLKINAKTPNDFHSPVRIGQTNQKTDTFN